MKKLKKDLLIKYFVLYLLLFFALFISITVMEIITKNYINKRIKLYETMQNSNGFRYTNDKDNDWMYKNINQYYDKIRGNDKDWYVELLKKKEAARRNADTLKHMKRGWKKEEVEIDEAKGTAYPATIDTLRMIVKDKQNQVVMFDKGQARVDLFTASAMVQVYDALKKPEMKKHFEKMIKDKAGFMKTQAFAMKMIGK